MQLLVSPRDIEEAKRSLAADIVDVKKPDEGSLGANFPWVIRAIKNLSTKPVSAAIGDYDFKPGGASLAAYGAAHAGADYIKIGLMLVRAARRSSTILVAFSASSVIRVSKICKPEVSINWFTLVGLPC